MLGEFFSALPEAIDDEVLIGGPSERFPTVVAKRLSPVSIASLGEILGAGSHDELLAQAASDHREASTQESGIWIVPSRVCEALVTADDLDTIAARWADTEELRLDRWTTNEAQDVLRLLAQLVRRRDEEQPVWYWWSL